MSGVGEIKKVAVIGAGFGGLAVAIRLQAQGFQVSLFEKNEKVGGHASQYEEKGYTFDMGPSLITAPRIINSVFRTAGADLTEYLDLIYLDPFYRIYFHDGSVIDYSADRDKMMRQMAAFNAEDAARYPAFLRYAKKLYKIVIQDGLGAQPFDLKKMMAFLPNALKLQALRSTFGVVSSYFKDFRNRFVFSFHPLFIGGSPFRSPAVYLMIPYLEKEEGVWFTKGGMYSVVKAFEQLFQELGGVLHTRSEVSEIMITEGRARGVVANGDKHEADIVVSNAHFAHTHLDLIEPRYRKKWTRSKVEGMDYSMSCFLLYLGVRKQYPQLLHHTLILSERYKGLVADIFKKKILPEDFSMYLHAPTRTDPGMAPPGCESLYVLIPTPNLQADVDWEKEKERYATKITRFLEHDFGLKDLSANTEVKKIFTPNDFERDRNSYLGSAWGVEPHLMQSASFRPGNRSEDVKGLYLVGASTHPGAGVPGVLLTAEATENAILEDFELAPRLRLAHHAA